MDLSELFTMYSKVKEILWSWNFLDKWSLIMSIFFVSVIAQDLFSLLKGSEEFFVSIYFLFHVIDNCLLYKMFYV